MSGKGTERGAGAKAAPGALTGGGIGAAGGTFLSDAVIGGGQGFAGGVGGPGGSVQVGGGGPGGGGSGGKVIVGGGDGGGGTGGKVHVGGGSGTGGKVLVGGGGGAPGGSGHVGNGGTVPGCTCIGGPILYGYLLGGYTARHGLCVHKCTRRAASPTLIFVRSPCSVRLSINAQPLVPFLFIFTAVVAFCHRKEKLSTPSLASKLVVYITTATAEEPLLRDCGVALALS